MGGFNPFKIIKKVVKPVVKIVKKVVKTAVNVVQKAVSWVTPSFPSFDAGGTGSVGSFGSSAMDNYEQGIIINKQSNDASIPVVYGERMVGGTRVFLRSSGNSNNYLYMALALAEGEINSVEQIYVDDTLVGWSGALTHGTTRNSYAGKYGTNILVQCFMGKDDQVASSLLTPVSGWGSNHRLRGVCYLAFRFKWNQNKFSAIPQVKVKIKGKKVVTLDSNLNESSETFSTNPAFCILDYLRNTRYGKGLATTDIDLQSFYDASQVCITQVTPYSGGSDINIFDTNFVLDTGRKVIDNLRELIKGCRGYLPYTQGKYKLIIETTGSASITLTEDNIIGGYVLSSPDKNSKFNRVIATYINPARNFQVDEAQFPPIDDSGLPSADQHSTMKTADGGVLLEGRFEFPSLTSTYQAEEMAEIILRRSREALVLQITADFNAYDLAIGDIVGITHSSLGFSAKNFRVLSITFNEDYTISLNLVEHQNSHYTWTSKSEISSTPTTTLPDPFTTINLSEVSNFLTVSDTIVAYNDGVIITKLLIDVLLLDQSQGFSGDGTELDPPDAFFDYFEVEISEDNQTFTEVGSGKQSRFEVLNVKDDTLYYVRVRYVNTAGVRSDYITASHTVVGQSAPPSNVQNFSINVVGDQAILSWDAVTDLDLSYYVIKHNSNTTGATWINSKNIIDKIGRPATTVTVPFSSGTYLIKAEDKRGNQSLIETLIVSNIETVNYTLETTINEHTAFSGSKTNVEVVQKNSVNHLGLTATGTLGVASTSVQSSGTYEFNNTITLPAVFKAKFESNVLQIVEDVANYIDAGRPSSSTLIDSGSPDPFDGKTVQNSNTILQIATSDDNVTFSAFQNFTTGEFSGRYFKFKALFTSADQDSRTLVNTLSVTASLKEKLESGADIVSGTGGKTITYSSAFRLNPAIIISGQNMATGDFFTITNKSTTAFTIEFFNSSGTSINRTFDFQAKGTG
tara:strand:+ start:2067 stop:4973 length:2907 start_codon:yes stop_codon:yes gene_type:complete